jgi:hypothetical protein
VPTANAFPGWTAIYSSTTITNVATQVAYDGISLGSTLISVVDKNAIIPFQGNYMAALFGGTSVASTLSQTALVPVGTKTLLADMSASNDAFAVTLGGETISMIPLQTFSNYTLYGGDVSAFAGQVSQLSFASLAGGAPNELLVDNIQFSSQLIPEPSVFGLLALVGLFLGLRRRHSQRNLLPG